jgi:hypothetical protein
MKKIVFLCFFTMMNWVCCNAQAVTWSEDVACIVFTHCTRCHNNTNSIAAIPFTNYYETWSQRLAIKYYIENKLMPPYQPSTENTRYTHEKTLTQDEINLIVAWVNQGTNQGDTSLVLTAPTITPLLTQISTPDLSYRIPAYTVPNFVGFQYHCFVLPTTYATEKKISEIEILPTNLSAIYSVFLYSDTSSISLTLDVAFTGNGYENYSGIGSPTAKLLYGWVNGNPLYHSPPNMALRLEANAHFVLRILFAEDALNKTDSTQVNIKYDSLSTRLIDVATLLNHDMNLQNPPFIIPADSMKTFYEQYTVSTDISVLSVSHWAQKFCSNMNCFAVTPTNDTINLLRIEDHEDLWSQGVHYFDKPKKIPANSILYGVAEYDNTSFNPNNPFSPPHIIVAGASDTTEQMLFSFSYLPYQTGDESIITDTILHQIHYLNCSPTHTVGIQDNTLSKNEWTLFPNPVSNIFSIQFKNEIQLSEIKISNVMGETVFTQIINNTTNAIFNVDGLNSGIYFLQIKSQNNFLTKKIIKQ